MQAKIINLAISKAKEVEWQHDMVLTGIFKNATQSRLKVSRLNIDGDEQADLTVHGGPDKAIYSYASEHYDIWKESHPEYEYSWSKFGENLTTSGLDEEEIFIGDVYKFGTTLLRVTQPRLPCYKLGIRFNDPRIINHFYKSRRWGVYFAVEAEGEIQTGDKIVYQSSDGNKVKLSAVAKVLLDPTAERHDFEQVLASNLAQQMKNHVQRKMFDRFRD